MANALWHIVSDGVENCYYLFRYMTTDLGQRRSEFLMFYPVHTGKTSFVFPPRVLATTPNWGYFSCCTQPMVTIEICLSWLLYIVIPISSAKIFALLLSSRALSITIPEESDMEVFDLHFSPNRKTSSYTNDMGKGKAKSSNECVNFKKASRETYCEVDTLSKILNNNKNWQRIWLIFLSRLRNVS